ncbi:pentatricopeptide repeat domain-containing protein 3, mitochondrial [Python bivittatus]|uniref:Small ribosomal subunit protein mS39 n=1 Tax=Python bivittatus TaxID=176946 RepID=A0A9F2WE65_PYTBI|nr:pentatricopeptide repeat domain-containing protein 3, mitochondrial [Python bivittatus]
MLARLPLTRRRLATKEPARVHGVRAAMFLITASASGLFPSSAADGRSVMAARWLRLSSFPTRDLFQRRLGGSGASGSFREGGERHYSENATLQEKSPILEEESIFLPRKKNWDKSAVLQTLASTVNRDITAVHYRFQDDPYLIPRNSLEHHFFSMSKASGQNAAKHIINTHPEFFEKDYAEPHIQCLMPEKLMLQLEEVSEVALNNLIQLRKVKASVNMYDQLLQAGTCISLETSNSLLDLLCFYGDREPDQEKDSELEKQEEILPRRQFARNTSKYQQITWRENNNAERIFNLMPEKNAYSYCTMIRGMVKHGACQKAFSMYTDLLNKKLKADVNTFNTLIVAAIEVKERYIEKWACIEDLLRQMVEQDIQPNLLTFNSVLKALKQCGKVPRAKARLTLNEMRTLNIEPSLATYYHLLCMSHKIARVADSQSHVLYAIINEIEGKAFYPQDPDDIHFFLSAMKTCLELKDVQLAYRLNRVVETAENRLMLGDMTHKNFYYVSFFELLAMMENLDALLNWYKKLVPSVFYPNIRTMLYLLQALDSGDCLELIPQIWKDIKQFGFSLKDPLVQEVLALMARDMQSPETQAAFADCAENIKSLHELKSRNTQLLWKDTSLNNTTILFARAGRTQDAWNMLTLFKKYSQVPSDLTVKEVFNCIKQSNQADKALELVKLTADYGIQSTSVLAKRTLEEFELSEGQRRTLVDIIEGGCGYK